MASPLGLWIGQLPLGHLFDATNPSILVLELAIGISFLVRNEQVRACGFLLSTCLHALIYLVFSLGASFPIGFACASVLLLPSRSWMKLWRSEGAAAYGHEVLKRKRNVRENHAQQWRLSQICIVVPSSCIICMVAQKNCTPSRHFFDLSNPGTCLLLPQ